mmetsp:Transcript_2025/g.3188  ORF Transcript_2025/g.3188 Transcript_2025/m.3188 type:complete len:253 (+) Transcript_2025:2584-3342(+)
MQFTLDISTMAKYNTDPRVATGLNCSRFSAMLALVSAAAVSLLLTSAAFAFVFARTPISSSSSNKFPVFEVNLSRRDASSAIRDFVFIFTSSRTSFSWSSRAFCSLPITLPRSCSSSPFCVTVKSTTVVLACNSGLKLGFGRRVMKYIMNFSSKSIILSDTLINILLPLRIICLSITGSSMGSISSSTPITISAIPSPMQNSSLSLSLGSVIEACPHAGTLLASLFLIQLIAWPCGSIINGKRLLRVTKIPF